MTTPAARPLVVGLQALGVRMAVEVTGADGAALVDEVERAWSRCLADPADVDDPAATLRLTADDDRVATLDGLSPAVTVEAITQQAGRLLMLHACGLADPGTGRAVALVAPSGVGKTTVASTLGRRWSYLTDETVAVDDEGHVVPYPKPLSIVDGTAWKRQVGPDELGLLPTPPRARLHAVALLARDGSVEPWLEEVPTLPALAALGPETSYLGRLERPLHRLAGLLEACGGLRVVHYAEADDLADVVASLLAAR